MTFTLPLTTSNWVDTGIKMTAGAPFVVSASYSVGAYNGSHTAFPEGTYNDNLDHPVQDLTSVYTQTGAQWLVIHPGYPCLSSNCRVSSLVVAVSATDPGQGYPNALQPNRGPTPLTASTNGNIWIAFNGAIFTSDSGSFTVTITIPVPDNTPLGSPFGLGQYGNAGQTNPPTPALPKDIMRFLGPALDNPETEENNVSIEPPTSSKSKKIKAPRGFKDPVERDALAKRIVKMIHAHEASMAGRLSEWDYIQKVYDDKEVPSSLDFLEDVEPYNVALMAPRIDGLVGFVCGGVTNSKPYFVLGAPGKSGERLDHLEETLHYALEQAGFDRHVRNAGLIAGLKGRGFLRLRYATLKEGFLPDEPDMLPQSGDTEVRYSGLVFDTIPAEQAVVYPTWVESVTEARLVGHAFYQSRRDMEQKQDAGLYFEDVDLPPASNEAGANLGHGQNEPGSIVDEQEDGGLLCYDVIVKLANPGQDFDSRYRCTVTYTSQRLLAMEPYDLPTPWYFAPGFRYEPKKFWPSCSIGERMLEAQTVYNDAFTLGVFGMAANAFPTTAVTGWTGDQQTMKMGIGTLLLFKSQPSFTPIPTQFDGKTVQILAEAMEKTADSLSRISQNGLGQQLAGTDTATEASILQSNQNAGISEFQANWGTEMERMGRFAIDLLARNWMDFKSYHQDAVPCETQDELVVRCKVEANGKSPANQPMQQIQNLMALGNVVKELGVPVIPSTKAISSDGVLQTVVNSLELNVSTSKIITDQPQTAPNVGAGPGQQNPLPPQLLQSLAQHLAGGASALGMAQGAAVNSGATGAPGQPAGVPPLAGGVPASGTVPL